MLSAFVTVAVVIAVVIVDWLNEKEQCSSGENNSNEESKTGAVAIQIMLAMDTYLAYRKWLKQSPRHGLMLDPLTHSPTVASSEGCCNLPAGMSEDRCRKYAPWLKQNNKGKLYCSTCRLTDFGIIDQLFTIPQTSGFRRFHCLTFNRSWLSISGFISKKSALGSMIPRSNIMMHLMIEIKPLAPSRWLHA